MGSRSARPEGRPEHELILCCARTRLEAGTAARIRELLGQEIDWDLLVGTAVRGGVASLLYRNLSSEAASSAPESWMAELKTRFLQCATANLRRADELPRVLSSLAARDILAIPLKGPALAALAYGDPALRPDPDMDVLLRQRDLPEAHAMLVQSGYRAALGDPAPDAIAAVPSRYFFDRDGGRLALQIHTERTLRHVPAALDLDELGRRLEGVSVGGREVRTLPVEDALWFLCVDASKHFWDHLLWVCDIAELVQSPRGVEWEQARARARGLGCGRMLRLGLALARELLGAPLPGDVVGWLRDDRTVEALAAEARARLFAETPSVPALAQRLSFRLRVSEGLWDGVRYCLRLATTPTEEDWLGLPLRGPLAALHPVLRPLNLLRRHGLGLGRGSPTDLAPFEPTPPSVVERMLALAELGPGDVLYDIGCGDGRIVVAAAKRYGARAAGFDVDRRRIREAKASARREGVQDLVRFERRDGKAVDVSEATVVTLYLTKPGNRKLRRTLREKLRPGARVVSRDFDMGDWLPERVETLEDPRGLSTRLYLWRIPRGGS